MTSDASWHAMATQAVPAQWSCTVATDLADVGEWNDILLYRFLVLDAEDPSLDPVEIVRALRTEFMLQIAVFVFGGSPELRDELRLARADRFYERDQVSEVLPQFFHQYRW